MSGKRSFCRKNDEFMQNQEPGMHSDKMCATSFTENMYPRYPTIYLANLSKHLGYVGKKPH